MGTGEIAKKQLDVAARFKEVGEYSREEASTGTPSEGGNTPTMYTLSLTASPRSSFVYYKYTSLSFGFFRQNPYICPQKYLYMFNPK